MAATTEPNHAETTPANAGLLAEPLADSFALETPRLRLRPPTEADCDDLLAAVNDSLPQFERWLVFCQGGYTRDACQAWIRKVVASWRESRDFAFAIVERTSGDVIGATGLNRIDVLGRWANLGYWLRTDRSGRGYGTEAALAVVRFGFDLLSLQRIEIFADVENVGSRRVAEKLGATFEGIARNRAPVAGVNHDAAVYSLIPTDALPRDTAAN